MARGYEMRSYGSSIKGQGKKAGVGQAACALGPMVTLGTFPTSPREPASEVVLQDSIAKTSLRFSKHSWTECASTLPWLSDERARAGLRWRPCGRGAINSSANCTLALRPE